jgi:hypothetical protein
MKDETALRKALLENLEGALAIAEALNESKVRSLIEVALDEARALDIERLRGGHR